MSKVNVQVRLEETMGTEIAALAPRSKSAFVREAIEEKLQKEKFRRLEEQWIRALLNQPQAKPEREAWLKAEAWGSR